MAEDKPSITAQDVIIDLLYFVAIAVNVYLIVDEMTNHELTRSVGRKLNEWEAEAERWRQERRQIKHDAFEVVQQAQEIVKEGQT